MPIVIIVVYIVFSIVWLASISFYCLYLNKNKKWLLNHGRKITTDFNKLTIASGSTRGGRASHSNYWIIAKGRDDYNDCLFKSDRLLTRPKWYRENLMQPENFKMIVDVALDSSKLNTLQPILSGQSIHETFDVYVDPNNKDNYYMDVRGYKKTDLKAWIKSYALTSLILILTVSAFLIFTFRMIQK